MIHCPICKTTLSENNHSYKCQNNHHFDQSKSGYTNLFITNSKKNHGDNDEMIYARHRFLNEGHYTFLLNQLSELFKEHSISSCVDLGCGEGYYTNHLSNAFEHIQFIGLDLSKTALKLASKHSNVKYFCASIADTPIDDHSVDCALCIFAPFKIEEVIRILKPNGIFIVVNPLPYHLYELKQHLYDSVKLNPQFELENNQLTHLNTVELNHELILNNSSSIRDLLDMTPYRYKAKESSINAFYRLNQLRTQCSFRCDVYKYTQ